MNKKKLFLILLMLILMTGCVKYDFETSIKTDKSVTLTLINAIQKGLYTGEEDNPIDENEYIKLGYAVEKYEDNYYSGIKLIKNYVSIDLISSPNCGTVELTSLLDKNTDEIILFKSNKTDTLTTYTADFTYDLTEDEESTTDNAQFDYSTFADTMVFRYSITLPNNATIISENADTKTNNGHTLSWNIKYNSIKKINFVFTIDDNDVTDTPVDALPIEEEKENTNIENVEEETIITEHKNSPFSYIISFLVVAATILGLVVLKIKFSNKTKVNGSSQMNHTAPPNNKNV